MVRYGFHTSCHVNPGDGSSGGVQLAPQSGLLPSSLSYSVFLGRICACVGSYIYFCSVERLSLLQGEEERVLSSMLRSGMCDWG